MTGPTPWTLAGARRERLLAVAEWFFPPTMAGYPSNAEADPEGTVLDVVLAELGPHHARLDALLDAMADQDVEMSLICLRENDIAGYELLRVVCAGRYLATEPVWRAIGYQGRRPRPVQPGEADLYLEGDLLGPPRRRGKIYRPTPAGEPPRPAR